MAHSCLNILYRPVRTALSALAVAMEVAMVMLFVGLAHGLVNDSARRQECVGAERHGTALRIFRSSSLSRKHPCP